MEESTLHEDVKSDLNTIAQMKFGILSAQDFYGTLGRVALSLSWLLLSITLAVHTAMYLLGISKHIYFSFSRLFDCWLAALGCGCVLSFFISEYVLFAKLVQGRLKTEIFIRQKCRELSRWYLVCFTIFYAIFFYMSLHFIEAWPEDNIFFAIYIFEGFIASLVITSLFINAEINRLGIGLLGDVIQAFVAKVQNKPFSSIDDNKNTSIPKNQTDESEAP